MQIYGTFMQFGSQLESYSSQFMNQNDIETISWRNMGLAGFSNSIAILLLLVPLYDNHDTRELVPGYIMVVT